MPKLSNQTTILDSSDVGIEAHGRRPLRFWSGSSLRLKNAMIQHTSVHNQPILQSWSSPDSDAVHCVGIFRVTGLRCVWWKGTD